MRSGILSAGLAFLCWGLFPIYFHALNDVPALQILTHRVLWCLAFLLIVLACTLKREDARDALILGPDLELPAEDAPYSTLPYRSIVASSSVRRAGSVLSLRM